MDSRSIERTSEPSLSPPAAAARLEAQVAALPLWQGAPVVRPLLGGLSNASFAVTDAAGTYVARLGGDYPVHEVDRARELRAGRAAHAAGFAPEIVYAAPGVMVTRFLEGRAYTPRDVHADLDRVVDFVRRFHREMAERVTGPVLAFEVFPIISRYLRLLDARPGVLQPRLPELTAAAETLAAAQPSLPHVFGHNDLLAANILDDGRRLWLIDFEYSGLASPLFDLANLASNAGFSEAESEALLEAYFGAPADAALRRAHLGMQVASLLREALWSFVSDHHLSAPGADYEGYGRLNLDRFDAAYAAWQAGGTT